MFSTGDLLPQQSGSASIGVNSFNREQSNVIVPYNNIHFISGVIHDPVYGGSGVLRYSNNLGGVFLTNPFGRVRGFEFSPNGGKDFSLALGGAFSVQGVGGGPHGIISSNPSENSHLYLIASGNIEQLTQTSLFARAVDSIFLFAQNSIGLATGDGFGDGFDIDLSSNRHITGFALENIELSAGAASPLQGVGGQVALSAFASSGRFQYRFGPHQAWYVKLSHANIGGPFNDGFWPLPHSGQIASMITAAGGGAQSLQAAYDGGDEVNIDRNINDRNVGIVLKEQNGTAFFDPLQIPSQAHLNYGIAVSGGTGANGFAFTKMIPNGIYIKSSGTAALGESSFVLGFTSNPLNAFIAANHNLAFFAFRNITYDAGTAAQQGGQITLRAFLGSGQLEYRYGPHQSWAMKVRNISTGGPASDGFWPIPHSGYIDTMILRAIKTKAITIERPAVNQDLTMWYTNEPITITEVESVVRGTADASGEFAIRYSTNRSLAGTELTTTTITCTNRTTGQITSSFAAPTIPADSWVWIGVSGVSGVATSQLNVTIQYR